MLDLIVRYCPGWWGIRVPSTGASRKEVCRLQACKESGCNVRESD